MLDVFVKDFNIVYMRMNKKRYGFVFFVWKCIFNYIKIYKVIGLFI